MSGAFQAPRGIPDYFPPNSADFRRVRDTLTDAARRAGYGHIELPIFEDRFFPAAPLSAEEMRELAETTGLDLTDRSLRRIYDYLIDHFGPRLALAVDTNYLGIKGAKENGGEVVQGLARLYEYCIYRLSDVSVTLSLDGLDEVVNLLGTLREGWEGVSAARK